MLANNSMLQTMFTHRTLLRSLAGVLASHSLLGALFAPEAHGVSAVNGKVRPVTDRWLRELHEASAGVAGGAISPADWQDRVGALFDRVPLEELLALTDLEVLRQDFPLPDTGVATRRVRFPTLSGIPEGVACIGKVFGMGRDRAVIPHGHRNMVSSHVVLSGEVHLRHYDRVADEGEHWVLEPTRDERAGPGSHSSISDARDNVHWLRALTDQAYTFDVIVVDLAGEPWEVQNLDPRSAERLAGGRLRARRLSVEEGLRIYGHDPHH